MEEFIRPFFNYFGGIKVVFYFMLFILSIFLFGSLIKQKKARLLFSAIGGLYFLLQLSSLFFTQSYIGYQFFVHLNVRGIQGIYGLYLPFIALALFVLVLATMILYLSHTFFYQKLESTLSRSGKRIPLKTFIAFSALIFAGIFLEKSSIIKDTTSLLPLFQQPDYSDFSEVLAEHGLHDYISPDQIMSKKGKNLVLFSLESIEKAFLGKEFSDLTPNLQHLQKKWTFYDLEQNPGSNWTSGSIYTYMTGFPAYFGINGNSIFQQVYHSRISSLIHVLKNAGYETIYMNGNANHSGIKEMLNAFGIDKVIDYQTSHIQKFGSPYGLRDKDLFELAKKELEKLSSSGKPFAIFISTTDTHFPNGIYDKRMEAFIPKKRSELEFMVAATDYMTGDLIRFMEQKKMFKNTAVCIFPDHLKMGDPSMFDGTGDRKLYFISNIRNKKNELSNIKTFYQIDLPWMILDAMDVQHNLKFLTDHIEGNKVQYINKHIFQLTEINTNGLLRTGAQTFETPDSSVHYLSYKKDTMRFIAHAGGRIGGFTYTNSLEAMDSSYEKGFRLFELDIIETSDGKFVAAHDWESWAYKTGYQGHLPVTLKQFMQYKIHNRFSPLDMNKINAWFSKHKDAMLVTDKVNDPDRFASAFKDPGRLIMELFDMKSVKSGIRANIHSSMPSQKVIEGMTIKDVSKLKKLGVRHIAISRSFIMYNKELLKEFARQNIKVYAFDINNQSGFIEDYAVKYEMDLIYGIYADNWNFE